MDSFLFSLFLSVSLSVSLYFSLERASERASERANAYRPCSYESLSSPAPAAAISNNRKTILTRKHTFMCMPLVPTDNPTNGSSECTFAYVAMPRCLSHRIHRIAACTALACLGARVHCANSTRTFVPNDCWKRRRKSKITAQNHGCIPSLEKRVYVFFSFFGEKRMFIVEKTLKRETDMALWRCNGASTTCKNK